MKIDLHELKRAVEDAIALESTMRPMSEEERRNFPLGPYDAVIGGFGITKIRDLGEPLKYDSWFGGIPERYLVPIEKDNGTPAE